MLGWRQTVVDARAIRERGFFLPFFMVYVLGDSTKPDIGKEPRNDPLQKKRFFFWTIHRLFNSTGMGESSCGTWLTMTISNAYIHTSLPNSIVAVNLGPPHTLALSQVHEHEDPQSIS